MPQWIMPVYIISGIVMAAGAYFTIRYRPYCTLKSPEREIAMELHRKHLMDEPMSTEEKERIKFYLSRTKKYNIGDFILYVSIPIHILSGLNWYRVSNLYLFTIILISLEFLFRRYDLSYCINFPYWKLVKEQLSYINIYFRGAKNEFLDDIEFNKYKNEYSRRLLSIFYRYSINTGVVLHLILDVLFGLSRSLTIN